jgi:hypothetical protein
MADPYDIRSLRVTPGKQSPKADKPKNHAENLAVAWGMSAQECDSEAEREAYILWILGDVDSGWIAGGSDRQPESGLRKALIELEQRGINALARILSDFIERKEPSAEVKAHLAKIHQTMNADPGWRRWQRLKRQGKNWFELSSEYPELWG